MGVLNLSNSRNIGPVEAKLWLIFNSRTITNTVLYIMIKAWLIYNTNKYISLLLCSAKVLYALKVHTGTV